MLSKENLKRVKIQGDDIVHNTEKSVIFEPEQVYSDGLSQNRSDFALLFSSKNRVKFNDTRAGCEIPKAKKQILYVNPNDVSFGIDDDFPVEDSSEQGFNQFKDDKDNGGSDWSYKQSKKDSDEDKRQFIVRNTIKK